LLMSGFYEADIPVIEERAKDNGLKLSSSSLKNNWAVMTFKK